MKIESNSAEETFALGKQCGEKAAAGQVYCLYGDLGVGKTNFVHFFRVTDAVHIKVIKWKSSLIVYL